MAGSAQGGREAQAIVRRPNAQGGRVCVCALSLRHFACPGRGGPRVWIGVQVLLEEPAFLAPVVQPSIRRLHDGEVGRPVRPVEADELEPVDGGQGPLVGAREACVQRDRRGSQRVRACVDQAPGRRSRQRRGSRRLGVDEARVDRDGARGVSGRRRRDGRLAGGLARVRGVDRRRRWGFGLPPAARPGAGAWASHVRAAPVAAIRIAIPAACVGFGVFHRGICQLFFCCWT